MSSTILVTGGTGNLGRHVVPLLRAGGWPVRVLSRGKRVQGDGGGGEGGGVGKDGSLEFVTGDVLNGVGLAEALAGVEVVLHLSGGPKGDDVATANLVRAAVAAGTVKHFVLISVIGADQVPIGYFRAKYGAERAVVESGLPWTVLRAAQFHDLALTTVRAMAKLPVVPAPKAVRWQPVDVRDVAARLAELTIGEPAGMVPDLAGPTVYALGDLARGYLRAVGKHRATVPVPVPGKVGRVYRDGGNLTIEGAAVGTRTWEEFLAENVAVG